MQQRNQANNGLTRYADVEICDFSKMKTQGMITIRPIKENLKKETKVSLKCFKGRDMEDLDENGQPRIVTFGIPVGTYPDNTPKFRLLTIRNQRTFNLNVRPEAQEYHVWKNSPEVEGSPNVSAMPRYMIFDPEADNKRIYGKALQKAKAVVLISNLNDGEVKDLARVFGIDPMTASLDIIKGRMVIAAEKNPEHVIDIFEDRGKTEAMKVYYKAKSYGLISFEPLKGYMWKGAHPLGSTETQAMQNLAMDSSLFAHAALESNQLEQQEAAKRNKIGNTAPKFNPVIPEENVNFKAAQPVKREINPGQQQNPIEFAGTPSGTEEKLPEDTF